VTTEYKPQPIDTAAVRLGDDLLRLSETLAKNAHERWAEQRIGDGWRYGPHRDDGRKEHPCLVPYEELPDSEKAYDRMIALETLRVLVSLGYSLQPPGAKGASPSEQGSKHDRYMATLRQADLGGLWESGPPDGLAEDLYQQVGERALQLGKPLLAYDALEEALKVRPRSARVRQLQALALLRGGAIERANALLVELDREGAADEETLGLLARTYKGLGFRSADPEVRSAALDRAQRAYERAYRLTAGYWTGINAATLAVVLGRRDAGAALARSVRDRCRGIVDDQSYTADERYWVIATLGEAALVLGDLVEAEDWYAKAAELGHGRFGDLTSTRRNARLLLERIDGDHSRIERLLSVPRVAVFTGHMIDAPGRIAPRFPAAMEDWARRAIRDRLAEHDARVGFAAGACGGDILFLESILDLGGEVNVILPYARDEFVADSVAIAGAEWERRFDRLVDRAAQLVIASPERFEAGSASYDYANALLLGLASIRAEQIETDVVPLALWNERPAGDGGTASIVADWRRRGRRVDVIPLDEGSAGRGTDTPGEEPRPPVAPEGSARIMAIFFADAVHYSKLTDRQIPRFFEQFLGPIGRLADEFSPVLRNTWGDGLYLVFAKVRDAGEFALGVADLVAATDWGSKGLPPGMNLRIALHAGPVYPCRDPVTGQTNYVGSHVSRGARIEPITPPGQVYASQAFAALAAAEGVRDFVCEYAGQTLWAKGYGTFPTYHVRRRERP
jgi:tetratricopeptide (TPR) repeat protein